MNDSYISRINLILTQLKNLNDQHEKHVRKKGEKFNVFSIIGREHYEVQIHSAIITELLNPDGLHGQGDVFLKLFLNLDKLKDKYNEISNCEDFKVSKEFSIPDKTGRIDLLIQTNDTRIAIENKIYAADQEIQLERYYEYTKYPVVYLTLYGSEPEGYTLGSLQVDKVICLSYEKDIVDWLDACIKEVPLLPQIREILYQYQTLVKSLTGQPIDREYVIETAKIFFEGKNCKLIPTLEESILEFKVQLQWKFWRDLNNKMQKLFTSEIDTIDNTKSIENLVDTIRRFYTPNARKKRYYGIIFIPYSKTTSEYAVKVEIDSGSVYWGITYPDENNCIYDIREKVGNILNKRQHDNRGVQQDGGWYGYIYPTYENYKYDFSFNDEESLEFIHMMTNEEDRKEIIGKLANNIEDAMKELQKTI